ncbi:MAG: TatA/E family twin arginine-targeting protein translocase [Cyanobacteria bacterium P01_A01_bin.84]
MNIFGIGLPEMAVIMLVALLIFGPKKLPEIGRSLGKAIRGFQDASKDFQSEFQKEAEQIEEAVKTTAQLETNEFETKGVATKEVETKEVETVESQKDG